jgi:hypothetical protein
LHINFTGIYTILTLRFKAPYIYILNTSSQEIILVWPNYDKVCMHAVGFEHGLDDHNFLFQKSNRERCQRWREKNKNDPDFREKERNRKKKERELKSEEQKQR